MWRFPWKVCWSLAGCITPEVQFRYGEGGQVFLHLIKDFALLEKVCRDAGEKHDPLVINGQWTLYSGRLHYPSFISITEELHYHGPGP